MLHRVRIGLHDEYLIDATLLDHLEGLPVADRGPTLLRYLRVGFQVAQQNVDPDTAFREAFMPSLKEGSPRERAAPTKPTRVATAKTAATQALAPAPSPINSPNAAESVPAAVNAEAVPIQPKTQEPELLSADPGALADEERVMDREDAIEPTPVKSGVDSFARMRNRAQQ